MNPEERPPKQEAFAAYLKEGWVSIHLDARRPGVIVPGPFLSEPHLVLQYGRKMPIPIPDLVVTEEGISATLSFNRVPAATHVPWQAVYIIACTDGRGVLYQEDVPDEIATAVMNEPDESSGAGGSPAEVSSQGEEEDGPNGAATGPAGARAPGPHRLRSQRRRLRSVPRQDERETIGSAGEAGDGPAGDPAVAEPGPAGNGTAQRRPHLRLVK